MDEPIVADSALKHGFTPDAILHAFRNPIRAYDVDDGFTMLIGTGPALAYSKLAWSADPTGQSLFTPCERANASSIER